MNAQNTADRVAAVLAGKPDGGGKYRIVLMPNDTYQVQRRWLYFFWQEHYRASISDLESCYIWIKHDIDYRNRVKKKPKVIDKL